MTLYKATCTQEEKDHQHHDISCSELQKDAALYSDRQLLNS